MLRDTTSTTHVLLVGRIRPHVLADLQESLPHCQFHRHRVRPETVEEKGRADRFRERLGMAPHEYTTRELEDRSLERRLREHPEIKYALALAEMAQRLLQSVLRSRTDVIGFGSVGALKRCVRRSAAIDLSDLGNRLVDHSYSYEAITAAAPRADATAGRVRLLVGPNNEFGLAMSLARAVTSNRPEVSAVALSVGEDGFPADLMLSGQDRDSPQVRRKVRAETKSVTHALVTPGHGQFPSVRSGPRFPPKRRRTRVVSGFDDESVAGSDYTLDPRASGEQIPWLPVVVPAGLLGQRSRVGDEPPRTLLIGLGGLPMDTARALALIGQARLTEMIHVDDVDPVIRLQTAATCAFVLDLRRRPTPDAVVLAALASGSILITDFSDWRGPVEAPPHIRRGLDPVGALAHALGNPASLVERRAAAQSYVNLHHDGRRSVAALAGFLDSRQS